MQQSQDDAEQAEQPLFSHLRHDLHLNMFVNMRLQQNYNPLQAPTIQNVMIIAAVEYTDELKQTSWIESCQDMNQLPLETAKTKIVQNIEKQYKRENRDFQSTKGFYQPTLNEIKKHLSQQQAKQSKFIIHYIGRHALLQLEDAIVLSQDEVTKQPLAVSVLEVAKILSEQALFVFDCNYAGLLVECLQSSKHDAIAFAACQSNQKLPYMQQAQLHLVPTDIFTYTLLNPLQGLFVAYIYKQQILLRSDCGFNKQVITTFSCVMELFQEKIEKNVSIHNELKVILKQLTDMLLFKSLNQFQYMKYCKQDKSLQMLFRNYFVCQRVMHVFNCQTCCNIPLPNQSENQLWNEFEMYINQALNYSETYTVENNSLNTTAENNTTPASGVLQMANYDVAGHDANNHSVSSVHLIQNENSVSQFIQQGQYYPEQQAVYFSFNEDQIQSFKLQLQYLKYDSACPQNLPIIIGLLDQQRCRSACLILLGKFIDICPNLIPQAVQLGLFLSILKILYQQKKDFERTLQSLSLDQVLDEYQKQQQLNQKDQIEKEAQLIQQLFQCLFILNKSLACDLTYTRFYKQFKQHQSVTDKEFLIKIHISILKNSNKELYRLKQQSLQQLVLLTNQHTNNIMTQNTLERDNLQFVTQIVQILINNNFVCLLQNYQQSKNVQIRIYSLVLLGNLMNYYISNTLFQQIQLHESQSQDMQQSLNDQQQKRRQQMFNRRNMSQVSLLQQNSSNSFSQPQYATIVDNTVHTQFLSALNNQQIFKNNVQKLAEFLTTILKNEQIVEVKLAAAYCFQQLFPNASNIGQVINYNDETSDKVANKNDSGTFTDNKTNKVDQLSSILKNITIDLPGQPKESQNDNEVTKIICVQKDILLFIFNDTILNQIKTSYTDEINQQLRYEIILIIYQIIPLYYNSLQVVLQKFILIYIKQIYTQETINKLFVKTQLEKLQEQINVVQNSNSSDVNVSEVKLQIILTILQQSCYDQQFNIKYGSNIIIKNMKSQAFNTLITQMKITKDFYIQFQENLKDFMSQEEQQIFEMKYFQFFEDYEIEKMQEVHMDQLIETQKLTDSKVQKTNVELNFSKIYDVLSMKKKSDSDIVNMSYNDYSSLKAVNSLNKQDQLIPYEPTVNMTNNQDFVLPDFDMDTIGQVQPMQHSQLINENHESSAPLSNQQQFDITGQSSVAEVSNSQQQAFKFEQIEFDAVNPPDLSDSDNDNKNVTKPTQKIKNSISGTLLGNNEPQSNDLPVMRMDSQVIDLNLPAFDMPVFNINDTQNSIPNVHASDKAKKYSFKSTFYQKRFEFIINKIEQLIISNQHIQTLSNVYHYNRVFTQLIQSQSSVLNLLIYSAQQQQLEDNLYQLALSQVRQMHRQISGCFVHNNVQCRDNGSLTGKICNLRCQVCNQSCQYGIIKLVSDIPIKSFSSILSHNNNYKQEYLKNYQTELQIRQIKTADSPVSTMYALIQKYNNSKQTNQNLTNYLQLLQKHVVSNNNMIQNTNQSFTIRIKQLLVQESSSQSQISNPFLNNMNAISNSPLNVVSEKQDILKSELVKIKQNLQNKKLPEECEQFVFAYPVSDNTECLLTEIVINLQNEFGETITKSKSQNAQKYQTLSIIEQTNCIKNAQLQNYTNILVDGNLYRQYQMNYEGQYVQLMISQIIKNYLQLDQLNNQKQHTHIQTKETDINTVIPIDQSCQLCRNMAVRRSLIQKCVEKKFCENDHFIYNPTREYAPLVQSATQSQSNSNLMQTSQKLNQIFNITKQKDNQKSPNMFQQLLKNFLCQIASPIPSLDQLQYCGEYYKQINLNPFYEENSETRIQVIDTFRHPQIARAMYRIMFTNIDQLLITINTTQNTQQNEFNLNNQEYQKVTDFLSSQCNTSEQLQVPQSPQRVFSQQPQIKMIHDKSTIPTEPQQQKLPEVYTELQDDNYLQAQIAFNKFDQKISEQIIPEQLQYLNQLKRKISNIDEFKDNNMVLLDQFQLNYKINFMKMHPVLPYIVTYSQQNDSLYIYDIQKRVNVNIIDQFTFNDVNAAVILGDSILTHQNHDLQQYQNSTKTVTNILSSVIQQQQLKNNNAFQLNQPDQYQISQSNVYYANQVDGETNAIQCPICSALRQANGFYCDCSQPKDFDLYQNKYDKLVDQTQKYALDSEFSEFLENDCILGSSLSTYYYKATQNYICNTIYQQSQTGGRLPDIFTSGSDFNLQNHSTSQSVSSVAGQNTNQLVQDQNCLSNIHFLNVHNTHQLLGVAVQTQNLQNCYYKIFQNVYDNACARQTASFQVFNSPVISQQEFQLNCLNLLGPMQTIDMYRRVSLFNQQIANNSDYNAFMRNELQQMYLGSKVQNVVSDLQAFQQVSSQPKQTQQLQNETSLQTPAKFISSLNNSKQSLQLNVLFARDKEIKLVDLQSEKVTFNRSQEQVDELGLQRITCICLNRNMMTFGDVEGNVQVFDTRRSERVNLFKFSEQVEKVFAESHEVVNCFLKSGVFMRKLNQTIDLLEIKPQNVQGQFKGYVKNNIGAFIQMRGQINIYDLSVAGSNNEHLRQKVVKMDKFGGIEFRDDGSLFGVWNDGAVRIYGDLM